MIHKQKDRMSQSRSPFDQELCAEEERETSNNQIGETVFGVQITLHFNSVEQPMIVIAALLIRPFCCLSGVGLFGADCVQNQINSIFCFLQI
jgi:hypothetical protein